MPSGIVGDNWSRSLAHNGDLERKLGHGLERHSRCSQRRCLEALGGNAQCRTVKAHAPPAPKEGEFRACFDVLQRTGEGARRTIYVFVLVYGAMLLWALNAVIYPAEQQRLIQIQDAAVRTVACLETVIAKEQLDADCISVLGGEHLTPPDGIKDQPKSQQFAPNASPAASSPSSVAPRYAITPQDAQAMEFDYLRGKIANAYANSAQTAQLHVPILGIVSDRTWLWLVNLTLGLFFYYLLRDSLANVAGLLAYITRDLASERTDFELLRTTQVVTASPGRLGNVWKFALIAAIFALPLCVSGLLIYDWINYLFAPASALTSNDRGTWQVGSIVVHYNRSFSAEPEAWGGLVTAFAFFWEAGLYYAVLRLGGRLFEISRQIGAGLSANAPA
jgi:hypothetical protein